jgi:hypothetical protein
VGDGFHETCISRVLSALHHRQRKALSCVACSRVLQVIGVEQSFALEPVILPWKCTDRIVVPVQVRSKSPLEVNKTSGRRRLLG